MYKSLAEQAISKEVGAGSPGAVNNLGRVLNKGAEIGGSMGRSYVQGAVTAGGSKSPLWKAAQHYGLINEKGNFNEGADLTGIRGKLNNDVNTKAGDIASDITGLGVIDKKGNLDQTMLQAAKVLGTMPGKDFNGDGKVGDFERGVGLMRLKQLQYSDGSATLDEAAAENLSNKTGFNFKAGDRVKFSYDSQTGAVSVAKGESGISKITKSGAMTEANYNGEQLKGLSKTLRNNGHSITADYLDHDLIPALQDNETASVSLKTDGKGRISTAKIAHGSEVAQFDEAKKDREVEIKGYKGTATRNGNTYELTGGQFKQVGKGKGAFLMYEGNVVGPEGREYSGPMKMDADHNIKSMKLEDYDQTTVGSVEKDVQRKEVDHGVTVGSAMQMALQKDPALASFVSDPGLNKYKLNANVAETAKDLTEDMGRFLTREGLSVGFSEGSAGLHTHAGADTGVLKVFGLDGGFKISADGRMGRRSQESETTDLLFSQYEQRIRQAVTEAREKGLSREETAKYVTNKIGDFTKNLHDQAIKTTSSDYGMDAAPHKISKVAKKMLDKVGDNVMPANEKELGDWKDKPD